jgi:putative PIN family toxin of toxin-antitoxin system
MENDIRAVIDTGVAVSAVLLPHSIPRQAFDLAADNGRLLVSEATIAELDEVLRRPKFNKYVPEEKRLEFLAALVRDAEVVDVTAVITDCRDVKDNKFLELAVSGRASHIVSGDPRHREECPMNSRKYCPRRAFSILELLVILVILGGLLVLLLPAV